MSPEHPKFDPYLHDPERWGVSLSQMAELIRPCLDAAGARSVAEVGAFAGDLTRLLVDWAAQAGAGSWRSTPRPRRGWSRSIASTRSWS